MPESVTAQHLSSLTAAPDYGHLPQLLFEEVEPRLGLPAKIKCERPPLGKNGHVHSLTDR